MYLLLLGFGGLGTTELLVILAIVFVLFGASRLPQLAKALGQSKRAFKEGIDDADEEAARERDRKQLAPDKRAGLSDIDDEALFEEARRRAQEARQSKTS